MLNVRGDRVLLVAMLAYGSASLVHFVHNAVYLEAYPNMPAWLTPLGVYAAWLVVGVTGLLGWWLLRRASRLAGLAVVAVYAALGFAGLDHYAIAPLAAHSAGMHATIVAEVIAAAVLLLVVATKVPDALRRARGSD